MQKKSVICLNGKGPWFSGGSVDKNPSANAGDTGLIPDQQGPSMPGATEPANRRSWARCREPGRHSSCAPCARARGPGRGPGGEGPAPGGEPPWLSAQGR